LVKGGNLMKKNQVYTLTIQPALRPAERHKIEDTLKKMGYQIRGGGTRMDLSECDIAFQKGEK